MKKKTVKSSDKDFSGKEVCVVLRMDVLVKMHGDVKT